MPHFFGNDLCRGFDEDSVTQNCFGTRWPRRQRRGSDKIDLAFRKGQLEIVVLLDVIRREVFRNLIQTWRQVSQEMGIADEDIDVFAETVTDDAAASAPYRLRSSSHPRERSRAD
jgi:hypothetical protein